MKIISNILDILDIYQKKQSRLPWALTFIWCLSSFILLASHAIETDHLGGALFLGFFAFIYLTGIIYQAFHFPEKQEKEELYVIVRRRNGRALMNTPVTKAEAEKHVSGINGMHLAYVPVHEMNVSAKKIADIRMAKSNRMTDILNSCVLFACSLTIAFCIAFTIWGSFVDEDARAFLLFLPILLIAGILFLRKAILDIREANKSYARRVRLAEKVWVDTYSGDL